jgi:hypothetical protein
MLNVDSASTPDSEVWDDETGETWGQARARFATFGPLLTATEALDAYADMRPGEVMMSFGYGDDPEAFDEVGEQELLEALNEDGAVAVTGYWGPFAIWSND